MWLAVATAFGHLFLSTIRPPAVDLRGWFAVAGAVSLVLASVTWSSQGRAVCFTSGLTALATAFIALALIALRLAHETSVVLLVGGALNAVLATMWFWTGDGLPVAGQG